MTLDVEHTIEGLEAEVDALRRKVAFVMKANATYSAGHATLHREHDETRQQLLLAMHWGAEQARELDRIEAEVVDISNDFRAEIAALTSRTPEQVSRETFAHDAGCPAIALEYVLGTARPACTCPTPEAL